MMQVRHLFTFRELTYSSIHTVWTGREENRDTNREGGRREGGKEGTDGGRKRGEGRGGRRKRGSRRDREIEGWRRREEEWTQSQLLGINVVDRV